MIKQLLIGFVFLLSLLSVYADNQDNTQNIDLYLNGTLGNVGTLNNSAPYTDPLNAFDENPSSFAYITSTTQNTSYQYLGKTFPNVFMDNIYIDLRFDKSGSGATLCDYKLDVLNDSGWATIQSGTNVQCLNNDISQNVSLGYSIYGLRVGMRNTVGSGDSRTLRIDDIIPYKTNLNGLNNYYNSSDYTLNFSNSFNDNSNLGIFLGSDSVEPSFNNGVLNGYVVNDGTCVNMGDTCNRTSSVNSSFGNAISFDGVDDYIDLGSNLNSLNNSFTVCSWFSTSSSSTQRIINFQNSADNSDRILLGVVGGQMFGRINGVAIQNTIVNDGNFHYGCLTYDNPNIKVYVDGSQVGTTGSVSSSSLSSNNVYVGSYYTGTLFSNYFLGELDSVMIYDFAMSQSEIQEQMSKTNPIVQSVANYNFDESQGTKVLDGNMFVQGNTTLDVWNRAMAFNGSQYIDIGEEILYNNPFTISYDFKLTENDDGIILSNGDNTNGFYIYQRRNINIFRVRFGGTAYDVSSWSPNFNTWYNHIINFNGSNLVIYQDGIVIKNVSASWTSPPNDNLYIGDWVSTNLGFKGDIDNLNIINKSLTSLEISQLYNRTFYNTSSLVFSTNAEQLNNTKVFDRKTQLCYNCSSVENTFYSPVEEGIYTLWSFDTFSSMRTISNLYFDYTNPSLIDGLSIEYNNTRTINLTEHITYSDAFSGVNSCVVEFNNSQTTNCSNESFTINQAGNFSYTITLTDNAFNQNTSSGVFYSNPTQYFRFQNEITSEFITSYSFGNYISVGEYVNIPLYDLQLGNNTLQFFKNGFNNQSFTFQINLSSLINNTYNISPTTLFLQVFNEENINEQLNIDITLIKDNYTELFTNQTNFSINWNSTINGEIQLLIQKSGYNDRSLYTNITSTSSISLEAYLIPVVNSTQVIFQTLNSVNENAVGNSILNFYRIINGQNLFIGQAVTDANGFTSFPIDITKQYEIIITKDSFITQQFNSLPSRIEYTIFLTPQGTVTEWLFKDFNYLFLPSSSQINSLPFNFSARYIDSENLISLATLTITGNNFSYSDSSTNPNSDILSINVSQESTQYIATLQVIRDGESYEFVKTYIYNNQTTFNSSIENISILLEGEENNSNRVLIMIVAVLIFAAAGVTVGGAGAGALAIMMPLTLFAIVGWVPVGLSMLLSVFIIVGVLVYQR